MSGRNRVREYRVRIRDMGQFQGIHARKLPWRRERRCGSEDSLENRGRCSGESRLSTVSIHPCFFGSFSVLHGATAVVQCTYKGLQSDYSSPNRVIAASGRPDGEADSDDNRNLPREVGAGRDIRVDARAERGYRRCSQPWLRVRCHDHGAALHGARDDVDSKHRRRDRHRRTGVRRSDTRQRHSLDRCCRRRCGCVGHSRSRWRTEWCNHA